MLIMLHLVISFLFLIFILFSLFSFGFSLLSIAPWVPSRTKDLERINHLADLKPGQTFCELGCGDGKVCRFVARKNPEAKIVGIEISFPMYLIAKLIQVFVGPKNVKIKFGNALKTDMSKIDVAFVFGVDDSMNKKLGPKFLQEIKKGAKIISYVFQIKNWPGKSMKDKPSDEDVSIYVYEL